MEHIRCVVERITYQNALNGYSVIKCRAKGWDDLVTVVGNMPDVHVGSVLYLGGGWRIDPKYGRQFAIETFEETLPATVYGMEKYLGSGLVKGIGPKFAQRICKEFLSDRPGEQGQRDPSYSYSGYREGDPALLRVAEESMTYGSRPNEGYGDEQL